jgi:hypothetical protein
LRSSTISERAATACQAEGPGAHRVGGDVVAVGLDHLARHRAEQVLVARVSRNRGRGAASVKRIV